MIRHHRQVSASEIQASMHVVHHFGLENAAETCFAGLYAVGEGLEVKGSTLIKQHLPSFRRWRS